MKRTHVLVLSLVLLAGTALAQQPNSPVLPQSSPATSQVQVPGTDSYPDRDRAQIAALVQQLNAAAINKDTAFFNSVLTPNYRAVNAQGVTEDKGDILKAHRDDDIRYDSVQNRGQDIQVQGDMATERSTDDVRGSYKGQRFDGTYESTRTFQRQPDGSWKIVSF